MREGIIPPNWTDILQRRSHRVALENIYRKYNRFTTDIEEDHSKTPRHKPIIAPGNNNKMITSP